MSVSTTSVLGVKVLEIKDLVVVETFAAQGLVFNNWQKSRALTRKCGNMGIKFQNTGIVTKNGFLFLDFMQKDKKLHFLRSPPENAVFCIFTFLRFLRFCIFTFFAFLSFL